MTVLDTHAWVWWVSASNRLSAAAEQAIQTALAADALFVSSISVWEVSLLVRVGRLQLTMDVEDWVSHSESLPFLQFRPVDNGIALRANSLPEPLHRDPADRIIIATALTLGASLVSQDEKIRRYPEVVTVW